MSKKPERGGKKNSKSPSGGFDMFRREVKPDASFSRPKKEIRKSKITPKQEEPSTTEDGSMRLNKYVSTSGIASRRKADEIIASGQVMVNDAVVNEPGYRVMPGDKVSYQGKVIKPQEQRIYILLNKPRGVITTLSDEKGRKTIYDLLKGTVSTRVFPVGRLDRDTTGLLLITNDGDLTKKLSHPSYEVRKIYHATLDRPISPEELDTIRNGIILEDGPIKVDGISHVKGAPQNEVGITVHSGRNRIIRRIFEAMNHEVIKLDRVYYAGLTKKDLPRGRMRFLTKEEVILLKHFKN